MQSRWKRRSFLVFCCILGLGVITFSPGLPWSGSIRHTLKRTIVKADMALANWQGQKPRFISIEGQVSGPGAQVQALDSRSGWATLADREGHFVLPDVMWYPRAVYELVISDDYTTGKLIKVRAPDAYPDSGVFNTGELNTSQASVVEIGRLSGVNSITFEDYDSANSDYYKDLYEKLTAGRQSDEEKLTAILDFVAGKLNYKETQVELGSPRRILERGSQYCGHLGTAFQTLVATGGYVSRAVHMSNGNTPPGTHAIVEVFYAGEWHLYDPTIGVKFQDKDGNIANYREMRLDNSRISELSRRSDLKVPREFLAELPSIYETGYHHFYYLKNQK